MAIGSWVANSLVLFGAGVCVEEVPVPVKRLPATGLITRSFVGPVEAPALIRHSMTVPFTGEVSPPAATLPLARALWANVQSAQPVATLGTLARLLPMVTLASPTAGVSNSIPAVKPRISTRLLIRGP
jgi:hypothetical protein